MSDETQFIRSVPVLAALNIAQSVAFYEKLGFTTRFQQEDYAIILIGAIEIHLWQCDDKYIADNTGCRVEVKHIEPLHQKYQQANVVHPNGPLREQPWGTREFTLLDIAGNIITFFERLPSTP